LRSAREWGFSETICNLWDRGSFWHFDGALPVRTSDEDVVRVSKRMDICWIEHIFESGTGGSGGFENDLPRLKGFMEFLHSNS
jgi:hypothetical protein